MKNTQIAVASSVSKASNYDAMDTLAFCKSHKLKAAQLYLDDRLVQDEALQKQVAHFSRDNGITLLCHLPDFLNPTTLKPEVSNAGLKLMSLQKVKTVVIHYDERLPLDHSLNAVKILTDQGFCVGVENFHLDTKAASVKKNLVDYVTLFEAAQKQKLDCTPVLDFPRLFFKKIADQIDGLQAAKTLIKQLGALQFKPIVHLIDYKDASQNRLSWCAIGQGILPTQTLFQTMAQENLPFSYCVLELEDPNHVDSSLPFLESI